ncbi:peptidoglycan-binding protein [Sporolactobacillus terrae]|uniref:peptidoglycan-binding protein n=1 Tax=Sporolactobacillus terrae TaxID=269673 RepID=UPI0013E3165D|nr:peptidoglycan-binding protein [Sporolactobacillus terrae]
MSLLSQKLGTAVPIQWQYTLAKNGQSKLGVYSGKSFLESRLNESDLRPGLLKWIARHNSTLGRSADFWQHTSGANVPGISGNVDENISYTDTITGGSGKVSKPAESKPAKEKPVAKKSSSGSLLKRGSRGSAVLALQKRFSSVYFYPDKGANNHGCDGIYGSKTEDAVRRFQLTHGLTADGIYGPQTAKALDKAVATQKKSKPKKSPTHKVVKGDTLWDLAIKNKTTVAELKKLNKLKSDIIYPGQILKLK